MSNFINDAVFGKTIGQYVFMEELTENPLIRLVLFFGVIATAGYFAIRFFKEASTLLV